MVKRRLKRVLAIVLALTMVVGMNFTAFAEEGESGAQNSAATVSGNTVSGNTVSGNTIKEEAPVEFGFATGEDEKAYWYENSTKQGTYDDPKCIFAMGALRGREIYDPVSDGWYWLDVVYDGAKACNKEVWMPYIYQEEASWDDAEIEANANNSGSMKQQVIDFIKNGSGKWVRYDANGMMVKGWYTVKGADAEIYPDQVGNTYYYDFKTGLMAKGWQTIEGEDYYFDEVTGVLKK